jgi:glycosyltransferase involved in cell wall biosynthesis
MTTLSVVIPALNEEQSIQAVMTRVLGTLPALQAVGIADLELIVVDDGSTDRTPEIVAATDGVRLICHKRNGGYGAALKTGFAAARGEWVGFLDADGTYPPEYFPALCNEGIAQNADIVIGSRMSGAESEMPAVRRLGNVLFANLVSLVSAQRITDSASGMRIFKKTILERVCPLPDGLNLTPVMSTRALHEGLHMIEVPIPYSERQGRSKLSVVRDGMRFARSIVWTALTYNPVRQLGMIGLACVAIAALVAVWIVALRLQGVVTLAPWGVFALFAGAVLGVVGVSLFILGAMFNYLVAIFYHRPIRQGLFGRPIFRTPLDRRFWWMGLAAIAVGIMLAVASLALGLSGWPLSRLWLWQLLGAMSILVGVQLVIGWFIMRVLEELSRREDQVNGDLRAVADRGCHDDSGRISSTAECEPPGSN